MITEAENVCERPLTCLIVLIVNDTQKTKEHLENASDNNLINIMMIPEQNDSQGCFILVERLRVKTKLDSLPNQKIIYLFSVKVLIHFFYLLSPSNLLFHN